MHRLAFERAGLARWTFVVALFAIGLLAVAPGALAHETKMVGPEDEYAISFGFRSEPIYTDTLNGLEIIIRRTSDDERIGFLEQSMLAEIIAPDGVTKRQLTLRGVWGEPGVYTADVVVTEPGFYQVRIWGFINDVEFDETFTTHEVTTLDAIKFP